jgi:hypothetical protein
MKQLRHLATLMLLISFFILASCASAPDSASGPDVADTPRETAEPAKPRDSAAPESQNETSQASYVEGFLSLADLGPTFSRYSMEELGMDDSIFGEQNELLSSGIFLNPLEFQFVMEFVFNTDDPMTRAGFTILSDNPELFAASFAYGFGEDARIIKQQQLSRLKGDGGGMEFLIETSEARFRIEIAIINGQEFSVLLMNMYLDGTKAEFSIYQLYDLIYDQLPI